MHVPSPTAVFVLFFTSSTAHVGATHVPDTDRNPNTIVAGANHFADLEAGLLPGDLDKRQQGTATGYAPGYSPPTTTFALGPTVYSTLTPGQTEISFSASLSCEGDTCIGQANGQTTWTTSNPFAASTSRSAAVSGSISSTTTRSEGTSNTIHPSTSSPPAAAANGDCPRLSMSILLCTTAVFASVVGITL